MEKRISYTEFQSVKSVAKACDPIIRKKELIEKKMNALKEEYDSYQKQIDALQAGVMSFVGFPVKDLVKRVVETNVDKTGKTIKTVKYVPTDKLKYDEVKKQYVVIIPDEDQCTAKPEKIEVPLPQTGNDYDLDKEYRVPQESEYVNPVDMEVFQ